MDKPLKEIGTLILESLNLKIPYRIQDDRSVELWSEELQGWHLFYKEIKK